MSKRALKGETRASQHRRCASIRLGTSSHLIGRKRKQTGNSQENEKEGDKKRSSRTNGSKQKGIMAGTGREDRTGEAHL